MECQYTGKPRKRKRGSTKAEVFAWMAFPFGLPYSLWRMLTKTSECAHCSSKLIYTTTSLQGHKMLLLLEDQVNGASKADIAEISADPTSTPQFQHPNPPEARQKVAPDPSVW